LFRTHLHSARKLVATTPSTPFQTTNNLDTTYTPPIKPVIMVRYGAHAIEVGKSARSRGSYLRVSFKNTRETAQAINGWKLQRAITYLQNVTEHKEAIPMRRYAGSTGRTAQGELDRTGTIEGVQRLIGHHSHLKIGRFI
jgi:hypothetical protein